jgi:2-dehydropantoate 2-reductase
MRVLVVGTGAVGGTFGAKLVQAGHDVTFVARGAHGDAIRKHGLTVHTPQGSIHVQAPVIGHIDEARGLGADVALVAVKSKNLAEVAAGTGAALAPDGVAIPLLNGLDSERELARVIGEKRVIGGVAQMAAGGLSPGHLYLRAGGMMTIAPLAAEQLELVRRIASVFGDAFPCTAEDDLERVLWQKLLWNAPFNAICALTRRTAGEVLALPELETLARDAMHEVVAVARAEGVELGEAAIEAMLGITRGVFAETTPSMLQDVQSSRETETDALQGAVVTRGRRHGIATPIHATLNALLRGLGPSGREDGSEESA